MCVRHRLRCVAPPLHHCTTHPTAPLLRPKKLLNDVIVLLHAQEVLPALCAVRSMSYEQVWLTRSWPGCPVFQAGQGLEAC